MTPLPPDAGRLTFFSQPGDSEGQRSCVAIRTEYRELQAQIDSGAVRVPNAGNAARRLAALKKQRDACEARCTTARTELTALETRAQSGSVSVGSAAEFATRINNARRTLHDCDGPSVAAPRVSAAGSTTGIVCVAARARLAEIQTIIDNNSARVSDVDRLFEEKTTLERTLRDCPRASAGVAPDCAGARARMAQLQTHIDAGFVRVQDADRVYNEQAALRRTLRGCPLPAAAPLVPCREARARLAQIQTIIDTNGARVSDVDRIYEEMVALQARVRTCRV